MSGGDGGDERERLRDADFTSVSGREVKPVYTPSDLEHRLGSPDELPGSYPFTRGIHPTMYRGRLWTMRQFSGFGTAEDTNRRYKFLLERGQTGLSVAFDFPTLMGYDSDHPRSEGEVGKCGVAISSLQDMQDLFDGIPLDRAARDAGEFHVPAHRQVPVRGAPRRQLGSQARQLGVACAHTRAPSFTPATIS